MRLLVYLFLGLCLPASLAAQSTETDLKARLIGKELYLRGGWASDKLHFDASGQLEGKSDVGPFTLSGVDVRDIHVEKDSLLIDARCVGLAFKGTKRVRVALQSGGNWGTRDETMRIQVDAPSDGNYIPALDSIFVGSLAALVPSLPDFWQQYARGNFVPAGAPSSGAVSSPDPTEEIKGATVAPQVLEAAVPIYPEAARLLRFGAPVTVSLYVEPDGTGSHFSILKPAGLGLDEQAIFAVQQYKFKPAMRGKVPTRVQLNVVVNFAAP